LNAVRAYEVLLRLYPRDHRALFAGEMLVAFQTGAEERRGQGSGAYLRFVFSELASLLAGAVAEWIAKSTTDSTIRGRCLPDRLKMRPLGVPWEVHYGEARAEFLVERTIYAISHHDFPGARRYSDEERQARENLRLLRKKHQIAEVGGA
jgi:hypothetical protein